MNVGQYLKNCKHKVEKALDATLPSAAISPHRLHQAIRYSVLNGGKRLRTALIYALGDALHGDTNTLTSLCMSIEMIHAGSLIHDDLPALDNDDLRRGVPTCHKAFGEATAILTGDALQSLAFETLANIDEREIDPKTKINMIQTLSRAIGSCGMTGGEEIDLEMVNQVVLAADIENMYRLKTGRLLAASLILAALACHIQEQSKLFHLEEFGNILGISFQIHDDIIGIESDTKTLGKKQNADLELNKPVYPVIVGMDDAKKRRDELYELALNHLSEANIGNSYLPKIAAYLIQRRH